MSTAIEFNDISKQYRLGLVSTRTLSHDLDRWWKVNVMHKEDPYLKIGSVNDRSAKADSEYVWALKDINFKVEQGDVVGIIGKNGAGKSTLLKLLSRVTGPTTGTICAKGRIGSLLEVGTGFHQEMTGRENIYLNGAILGMTKHEITRKLDEIVDFSGCERYIDTPVKRYSSGMMVRLGFAVAAHLDPEILVVDEVLAVGDAEFQKKAIGKMQDVSKGEGRTVLFVSHNMTSVKSLCNRGIVLNNGMVTFDGTVGDAIERYLFKEHEEEQTLLSSLHYCSPKIQIERFELNGSEMDTVCLESGKTSVEYFISGKVNETVKMDLEARLYDPSGSLIGVYAPSHVKAITPEFVKGDFVLSNRIEFPKEMTHGEYRLELSLAHPNVEVIADFNKPVLLRAEGVIAANGRNFSYQDNGFLMLG